MSELAKRITDAVGAIRLVDTHEHLFSEEERNRAALDFGYLFPHYASSDLISSGMPPAVLESVRATARPVLVERMARIGWIRKPPPFAAPSDPTLSLDDRWAALAPYWESIRTTGYGTCLRIAIRDLFGEPDLNQQTYRRLSEAIAASRRAGWYRHVLKEKARIAVSIQDDYRTGVDRELFAPVVRLEHFACATPPERSASHTGSVVILDAHHNAGLVFQDVSVPSGTAPNSDRLGESAVGLLVQVRHAEDCSRYAGRFRTRWSGDSPPPP